jgi:hypothetical protein
VSHSGKENMSNIQYFKIIMERNFEIDCKGTKYHVEIYSDSNNECDLALIRTKGFPSLIVYRHPKTADITGPKLEDLIKNDIKTAAGGFLTIKP